MNGILNVYKPKGPTSHDVVNELRRKTKERKVGHAGTLDPFARGVLVIGIGRRATRILDLLKGERKTYWVKMQLGLVTETFDITGQVREENECDKSEDEIVETIMSFEGEYMQVPPAYSAKKYKGRKLYEFARQGKIIRLSPRKVTIYRIWNIEIDLPFVSFRTEVSPGTYIRSLCVDIGYKLGCGATAVELVREKVGNFLIEDSVNPFELSSEKIHEHLIPIENVLKNMPGLVLTEHGKRKVLNGGHPFLEDIDRTVGDFKKDQMIKLVSKDGVIIALAKAERNSSFIVNLERHGRNERIAKLEKVLGES